MGKRYTLLGMIAVLVLLMGAVLLWSMRERPVPAVQAAPLAESEADDPPTVLKLFSPYSSGSFPSHVLKVFCDSVYSMSDNALAVQLYEGGAFREERNNLQALESGTLEMCAVSCDCLPQLLPEAAPLFTMFRCSSREEAMALLEGGEAQELYRQMEDMGILRLGSFWNGFRWLWTTEPVSSAEDFSALRLGIPDVRMLQSGFQNLTDTLVVTNGGSLSLSLQSGSINACEQDLTEVTQQGISPRLCQKTTVWGAPNPRLLCSRKKYPALLPELRPRGLKNNSPHPKAAIRFFIPTIFRARFILNAKNVNDNSPSAFWIPRSRSCLTPISCLTVPKGCSTIHFRWDEMALFCKMRIFFNGTGDISHSLLNSDFFIIRST